MNASTTMSGTESAAPHFKSKTASEIQNLVADVEDLLAKVAHNSDAGIAKLRASVQEKIAGVKETLAVSSKRVTETARAAAGATDDYVHSNPWQAIGIAALAGTFVGYLLARRS